MTDEAFRQQFHDSLKEFAGLATPDDVSTALAQEMRYVQGEMDDPDLYARLGGARKKTAITCRACCTTWRFPRRSTGRSPSTSARPASSSRKRARLAPRDRREAVRHGPGSAREALNQLLHEHLDESQIFRIDHYLGKETVQNLLVFRFANGMFEPVWNRRYIDHVQITAAETVGVERRASYYEGAGALRDMVQNHLMQVLALIAMEPPIAFSAENVRDRKLDALMSIQPVVEAETNNSTANVVRAQYAAGWVNGEEVPGYRHEEGVSAQSTTDTFVALRMFLDSWRWAGRAVLRPHRQTVAEAHDRDRDPVPAAAAAHLQEDQPDVDRARIC